MPEHVKKMTVSCNIHWKEDNGQYVNSKAIYVGKVRVASYYYDGTVSRGDKKVYSVSSKQPNLKNDLGRYETEDEAIERCLKIAEHFVLNMLGFECEQDASIEDIRAAFADYFSSEGCDCCRNTPKHNKSENELAKMLKCDKYDDGSGNNWYKYKSEE